MNALKFACALLLACGSLGAAHARDTRLLVPLEEVVQMGLADGKLDGSVTFHLSGAATPPIQEALGDDVSNKKTNGVGKDDLTACRWAALSALIAFQASAKKRGADAVVDMHSVYKGNTVKDPVNFECHAGNIVVGVALKGSYAKTR
ncbi:excinuclease ATPase subunit [uncultured Comamonas sp.]|uniref:excinuclease ATPase subunit n=1 Tax=uncultured Comamonas sp. TaxID=114710 RepID=UPI00374A571A